MNTQLWDELEAAVIANNALHFLTGRLLESGKSCGHLSEPSTIAGICELQQTTSDRLQKAQLAVRNAHHALKVA